MMRLAQLESGHPHAVVLNSPRRSRRGAADLDPALLGVSGYPVDIATPDGVMDAYVAHPDDAAPRPLVVVFMDIWGLREELFGIVRRIAGEGHYCVVPNLFHREGKFSFAPQNADGRTLSFDLLPDDVQREMRGRAERLNRATLRTDVAAILEFCKRQPVREGPAGSIGYCMGGREAFFAAQEFPARFRATASLHGSRLVTEAADSPHRLTERMRGEVYCGFAEFDRGAPPEVIGRIEDALRSNRDLTFTTQVHQGARHGYALPDRDVHDHTATEADWASIFAMYRRQLAV
jgi:carboxymethylenebutenolidase